MYPSSLVSPAQLQQLRDEGYYITKPLFDATTLDAVQAEFQRMWDEDIAKAERDGRPVDVEFARLRPFFSHLERRSPVCAAFCKSAPLVDLGRQIVGSDDIDISWNQAIVKPPGRGKAFAWHQDSHYAVSNTHANGVPREQYLKFGWAVTTWVAITRTTVENGTLWVVPGRHKEGLLPHIWSEENREWQCQLDTANKVAAVLERGQALVFTGLTPHCSGPNISDEVRMAYQIGYVRPGVLKNNYQIPALRAGRPV